MPLDGPADISKTPDFSQMSLSDFLKDARVPTALRDGKLLELQRSSTNAGDMKVSDFLRRDLKEEEAYVRKMQRDIQDWLDGLKFEILNARVEVQIKDEKSAVNVEIDKINAVISKLERKKSKSKSKPVKIETLKRAREDLKAYKIELSNLENERSASSALDEIKVVAADVQTTAAAAQTARSSARSYRKTVSPAKKSAVKAKSAKASRSVRKAKPIIEDSDDEDDSISGESDEERMDAPRIHHGGAQSSPRSPQRSAHHSSPQRPAARVTPSLDPH